MKDCPLYIEATMIGIQHLVWDLGKMRHDGYGECVIVPIVSSSKVLGTKKRGKGLQEEGETSWQQRSLEENIFSKMLWYLVL